MVSYFDAVVPESLTLMRGKGHWATAVYMNGVMDGYLPDLSLDAPVAEAQAAFVARIEHGIDNSIQVDWRESGDGVWTTDVHLQPPT